MIFLNYDKGVGLSKKKRLELTESSGIQKTKPNHSGFPLISEINSRFSTVKIDSEWAFSDCRSTDYWTHGYHRYPAKFLPQLVKKLIEKYSKDQDIIGDVFAGCGTTLVESKIHGKESIGVDINPVARLITNAKINPINPSKLNKVYSKIEKSIDSYKINKNAKIPAHKRIDYWFNYDNKIKIAFLYSEILLIHNLKIRDFFLCALSNILKNCSKWLQTSTKPQVDPMKIPADPFLAFKNQSKRMMNKNEEFYNELSQKGLINKRCVIKLADARKTRIKSGTVGTIITSPPYVTSYEYADIHQLTGYWFEYISDITAFRKNFIGTFFSNNPTMTTKSTIAQAIVNRIKKKSVRTAREIANYFNDMYDVATEMKRILKNDGRVCLVIGNTTFKNVRIKSAEAFAEILLMLGFEIEEIIKREIPFKLIPTIRDKKSGRFTTLDNKNKKLVYPEEFIIIAKKSLSQ